MTDRLFRSALLGATAALALVPVTPALAQTAEATTPAAAQPGAAQPGAAQPATGAAPAGEPTTVVVRGARPIAESARAALIVQRASPALVSVLSADEAGRLADQNIAFAVGRLPGVGVQRDQGQARYINLRGLPGRYVTISFDGIGVVSPEGRATRFDNIPSAIASQVVVNKAVTPDMPGDTVAGNVNIRTRSAFDYPGQRISGGLQIGHVELGDGQELDASLIYSNRLFNDTIGVLLQGSYYSREMITDNFETDPMLLPGTFDRRPGFETRQWAREFENKPYRLDRGNISGSARLDWRPTDGDRMFVQSVYTQYTDDELRNNYIFRFDANAVTTPTTDCPAIPAPITTSAAFDICAGNTPERGTVYGTRIDGNFNSLHSKEYILTSTLGGDHERFGWNIGWRLNYTETEDGSDAGALPNFQSPADIALRPTVEYDFTDPQANIVRLFTTNVAPGTGVRSRGARQFSIDAFPLALTNISKRDNSGDLTNAWTAAINASREIELFGQDIEFKTGLMFITRTKKPNAEVWTATAAQIQAAGLPPITYNDFALEQPFLGAMTMGYTFRYHGEKRLEAIIDNLVARGIATPVDQTGNYFRVTEEILAGYAMGTWRFDRGSVVFGVRAERTENTGRSILNLNNVRSILSVSRDDVKVYPSLHVNYDVTDDVKVRVGFTTGASRPEFTTFRPNFTFSDTTRTVSGGNPDAKPESAVGVDAYVEWYIQPQGFFSAGVFYKDLSDVLFTQVRPFGLDVLNFGGVDRSAYEFSAVQNAGSGRVQGFEIAYSQFAEDLVQRMNWPDWLGGFGINATATWADSEVSVPGNPRANPVTESFTSSLPGASDFLYNLSLIYEKYGLSARIAYQFRQAWQNGIGSYTLVNGRLVPTGNGDNFWDDDAEMDISIRYQLNENFQFTLDFANVLNEPAIRYGDPAFVGNARLEWERFGRRFLAGFRFTY